MINISWNICINKNRVTEWRKMYRWRGKTKQLVIDKNTKEPLKSILP